MKAERGKETMALNNYDELQSLVLEVLGQAVTLSLIGETTEVLKTHESPALAAEETPQDLEHHPCCIPRIYNGGKTTFSSHSAPRFGRACTAQV